MVSITLEQEKFSTFLDILGLLKGSCRDISIVNGICSQLTDSPNSLFVIDLTQILGSNVTFRMSSFAQKLDILEPWRKQQVEKVYLEIEENRYVKFWDELSEIKFSMPNKISNKEMEESVFKTKYNYNTSQTIFSSLFGKNMLDRLSSYSKSIQAGELVIALEEGSAAFSLSMCDNKSPMSVYWIRKLDFENTNNMIGDFKLTLSVLPISVGNINMAVMYSESKRDMVYTQIFCELGNNFKAPINIYTNSWFHPVGTAGGSVVEELTPEDANEISADLDSLLGDDDLGGGVDFE